MCAVEHIHSIDREHGSEVRGKIAVVRKFKVRGRRCSDGIVMLLDLLAVRRGIRHAELLVTTTNYGPLGRLWVRIVLRQFRGEGRVMFWNEIFPKSEKKRRRGSRVHVM